MLFYIYKKVLLIGDFCFKILGVIIGSFGYEMDCLFVLVVFIEVVVVYFFGFLKIFFIVVIVVKLYDYRVSVVFKIILVKRMF